MKIRQKLLCGFLFVSVLTLGVSYGTGLLVQEETVATFQEVGGEILPGNLSLARMSTELYHTLVLLAQYEETPDKETRAEIEKALATLSTYKTMHVLFHTNEALQIRIERLVQDFSRSVAQYLLLLQKGTQGEEVRTARQRINELLNVFIESVNPHIEAEFAQSFQKLAVSKQKTLEARKMLLVAGAAILLLALLLSLFISHLLSKPLLALRDAAREIGGGRLDLTLPVTSRDEISDLALAFNEMAGNLSVMRTELVSARDYIDNIVDSMADALVVVSPAGLIETVNASARTLLQYQENELNGQPLQTILQEKLFHGSDLAELADKEALRDLNVFFLTKSGEPIPMSISGSAMHDQNGNLQAIILVARDIRELSLLVTELNKTNQQLKGEIAERIQAEQALTASERNYREIFNATTEAILLHDADNGAILDVNIAMSEIYGYSRAEALTYTFGDLSSDEPPYTGEEAVAMIRKAATEGPQIFDWQARRKNGEQFWVEISLKGSELGGHGRVLAVVRDITERKLAEDALATEKERLAVTLRSIGDGVITTDIHGKVMLINKVAEALTGWRQQAAVGQPFSEVFQIINEKTRTPCDNPVEKVLATGQIVGLANHTVLIAKDGTERNIADSGAPIRDRHSQTIGVVLVFRDVTEEEKLEKELLKVKKLESVGVLAGGIAHDFNNILAAILGNISLAMDFIGPEDKAHKLLAEAEKASERARDLTQQLLTFSKGGEPIKKLAAITEIIRESSQFVLRGSNVRCTYHFAEDLWPVEIDSGQISQVIQNIVINADHAMPEGGTIEVNCENVPAEHVASLAPDLNGPAIKLTIRDHGIGIIREHLEKIFDPYFSTKSKGSGLGLAITHSIITKHHGAILVKSQPGEGTTFTILLPAAAERALPVPPKAVGPSREKATTPSRILVMDDEEMVLAVSTRMLSRLGYEVLTARDGGEAIELYRTAMAEGARFALCILDLTIPGGLGGKETAQEILAMDDQARLLASSGYSNAPIMANPRDHGFAGAITKPYRLDELNAMLTDVLKEQ